MNDNFSTEELNAVERIELAINESRRQQERIDRLVRETRNETRPVVVEENNREIERLTREHEEYDEMTRAGYLRYMNRHNEIINRLIVEQATNKLNDAKSRMLELAIERRDQLLDLSRNNSDILFVVGRGNGRSNVGGTTGVESVKEAKKDDKDTTKGKKDSKDDTKDKIMEKGANKAGAGVSVTDSDGNIIIDGDGNVVIIGGKDRETDEDRIKRKAERYLHDCDLIKKHLNEILAKLVLDSSYDLNLNDFVKNLTTEIKELETQANDLISEVDAFKEKYKANPGMSYEEIVANVNELKDKLKMLKRMQREKYNAKVDSLNERIQHLTNDVDLSTLDPEIVAKINGLTNVSRCDAEVKDWRSISYLRDYIDYNKLLEVNKLLDEIEKKLGVGPKKPEPGETVDLESDIKYIENELARIDYYVVDEMTREAIDKISEDITEVASLVVAFELKLEDNKDKMTEEQYEKYKERLEMAQSDLYELNERLKKTKVKDPKAKENDYDKIMRELSQLSKEVWNFDSLVDALNGKLVVGAEVVLDGKLDDYVIRLDNIKSMIELSHTEGRLDDVQYDNLMQTVAKIKEKIEEIRAKIKDPKMYKETDIFAFLNEQIDGLTKAIDALEKQVDALKKPIKDRKVRKAIDATIIRLEEEIKIIRSYLEKYKEEDTAKYEAASKRLEKQEERLKAISKKYRSKCPLIVKAKKSAKDFYKKHKKAVLIAAGLAAIALIHATVGPIIMPAIMHGNLMIMNKVPALRPFLKGVNGILGKLINAKEVTFQGHKFWELANGVRINPSCAATSLLKGVAISGIGSVALVAPVVAAIKSLVDKMKKKSLKDTVTKGKEKVKGAVEDTKKKIEKPFKKKKEKTSDSKVKSELLEMYKQYKLHGGTPEEFVADNDLDEKYIEMLKDLDMVYSEEVKRGGRR